MHFITTCSVLESSLPLSSSLKEGCCLAYHFPSKLHLQPPLSKQALTTHLSRDIPFSSPSPISYISNCISPFLKKLSVQWLWHDLKRFALPRKCCELGPHKEIRVSHSGLFASAFQAVKCKPWGTPCKPIWLSWGPRASLPKQQIMEK